MTELERMEELISLYALGILEGEELTEAERLISAGSSETLSMLRDYERVVSMMSYATPGVAPDPALKKKLLSDLKQGLSAYKVKETPPSLLDRIRPLWLGLGGAVAAAAILVLVISNISLRNNLNDSSTLIAGLEERVTLQQQELQSLEGELAQNEELVSFLQDPDVVVVKLSDTHPVHDPGGRVHWDKGDDEALFVSYNLPETPSGKSYQWWVVADDTPRSAGVFKVGPDGTSLMKIGELSDFGNIQNFILTMEPEGGAESPSSERLLIADSL